MRVVILIHFSKSPCALVNTGKEQADCDIETKPTLRTPEFRDFRRGLLSFPPLLRGRGSGAPIGDPLVTSTPGEACAPSNGGRTPPGAPPRCFLPSPGRASEPDRHLRPGSTRDFRPALHPARMPPCGGSLLAEADGGSRCAGDSDGRV